MAILINTSQEHKNTGVSYTGMYATIKRHISCNAGTNIKYSIASVVHYYKDEAAYTAGKQPIFTQHHCFTTDDDITANLWSWYYDQLKNIYGAENCTDV